MKNPYLKNELKYFLHTFKRQPLMIQKARGSYVWDMKGKKYLDFYSGIAVCGVGHNHKKVRAAIHTQTEKLLHSSNYFYTPPQMSLAQKLTGFYPGSRVFFSNSGAEANELAVKLARLWAAQMNKPGREILVFQNAFHGRTMMMSAASQGIKRGSQVYAPLPKGFISIPFNNLEKVKNAITKKTIAIWLEPIQGEGGIHIASHDFMKGIAALCHRHQLLLMLDEVQSGLGRTGSFFAFENYGLKPDIITLAKGLAGGLPLGATLALPHVAKYMAPGLHGSTFGGNPVSCAASLEVLKLLTPKTLRQIKRTAQRMGTLLRPLQNYSFVKTIRQMGLMVGIELKEPGDTYVSLAREKGLLINCTQGHILRFLPPYFISTKELTQAIAILHSVFHARSNNKVV